LAYTNEIIDALAPPKPGESKTGADSGPVATFKKWYDEAKTSLADWQKEALEDSNFYHGGKGQWDKEDIDVLKAEKRPVLSINRIKPTIDLQKGIEIRSRTDIDARPRGSEDGGIADAITSGFKYVQDQNNADHKISDVFFDGLKCGIGWIEVCTNDDPTEEEIAINYVSWKNVGWDPHAREILLDDARYMFKEKWVDLDVAQATWPDKSEELRAGMDSARAEGSTHTRVKPDQYASSEGLKWCDTLRDRVLLVQMYYKKPELSIFLKLKNGDAVEVTEEKLKAQPAIVAHPAVIKVIKRPVDKIYSCIFTGGTILEAEAPLQEKHNRYPLIPFICYLDEDGKPYGMTRNMKDPQREINKNRSQYSHIITTRRVFFESGALKDPLGAKKEISRPDAWIELQVGALTNKRFEFSQDVAVAREHFEIMREAKQELQEVSGAVEEQMGQQTNARSGIAIEARQRQGATVNTEPFDNLRLTKRRMGELMLALMRQHWTYEKVIRITDDQTGADKFVTFNQNGQNMIAQGRFDIVVADHPETETTRNWMSKTLMDFATRQPPEIGLAMVQTALEMSDVPNKDKVMQRIKEAQEKQDKLTQQKILAEAINKEKPAKREKAAPEQPKAMGPAEPGISAEEALKKILAGETWGAVTEIKDSTVEKAAEFIKAPKPPPGGDTPEKKKSPTTA